MLVKDSKQQPLVSCFIRIKEWPECTASTITLRPVFCSTQFSVHFICESNTKSFFGNAIANHHHLNHFCLINAYHFIYYLIAVFAPAIKSELSFTFGLKKAPAFRQISIEGFGFSLVAALVFKGGDGRGHGSGREEDNRHSR